MNDRIHDMFEVPGSNNITTGQDGSGYMAAIIKASLFQDTKVDNCLH